MYLRTSSAKDEEQEHLAGLLAPTCLGSLTKGVNSLRQESREPWWVFEVGSHLHAQELSMLHAAPFSGGLSDDVGDTSMSSRLGPMTTHSCDPPPAPLPHPLHLFPESSSFCSTPHRRLNQLPSFADTCPLASPFLIQCLWLISIHALSTLFCLDFILLQETS